MQDANYNFFIKKIREKTGLDLGSYKEQQMHRRIRQLMHRYGTQDFQEFLTMLDKDQGIFEKFTNYLTINTSQFFRDSIVYRALETKILPELITSGSLKVWSAGCSIGAEPYSLAIMLSEQAQHKSWQILATDIDRNILVKAIEGKYAKDILGNVPKHYLERYFSSNDGIFQVNDSIKRTVKFRYQNLLTDHFEKGFNLILCRNVFIYFTQEVQQTLINQFCQSLKPGGFFIVGCSEIITTIKDNGLIRIQPAIYQKI